ncbi:hypothetical protein SAMN05216353_13028 [Halobacillus alkaliphilus]|uniref:UPF0182 protein SAMN05216353_13028 n=1 Tax=Halobacillus alkaliphilus TaxID=396056 RepID=A0A1I2Q9F4_9BACI|nr:UPF0182 family protein [Halobacillus alkaliphilus]SFG25105.1 hypothetical protein SAMN05216353_13028 [Halobacillus alkaliphilus]
MDKLNNIRPLPSGKQKKYLGLAGKIIGVLLFLLLLLWLSLSWLTDYIWMDSLGFKSVYTTIFSTKILLGIIGFIVFFALTYVTLSLIRKGYGRYFERTELPSVIRDKKWGRLISLGISALIGLFGSSIVQGVGWELWLKFLNHSSFGVTDPHFSMDISFYMFVLPFINFTVNVLMGLGIFLLLVQIGFYSAFQMYQKSRFAQLHMGITLGVIALLLALQHVLAPFGTLLTNQVNIFQNSTVYGLSYTDDVINIPASYVLAGAAVVGAIWIVAALMKGKYRAMLIPVIAYIGIALLSQAASVIVQNYVVSPNEFSKETPYLEHNLKFTRAAYDLESIEERQHPGNEKLDQSLVENNQLTLNNVRINDARPILDIYNQLQTFRTYYEFNDIDIDRYQVDGEYQQVFLGARELNTSDLPSQAKTWVNENLRYTHGYGIAMSDVNKITPQGQPEYMLKNLPSQGVMDITRPQIYFGEENYQNVIVNSGVDEFDYPSGEENKSTRFEADTGIPLSGINRFLFSLEAGSFRMFVSDQVTGESQLLAERNIMDRVEKIAPFLQYDEDPYIFVRDDGSLSWMLDAYVTGERYPYSEPHQGEENYVRNSVKVTIDAYTGDVNFYAVNADEPLVQTYQKMFPELFTEEIPSDVRSHFRYPVDLFKIQASMYGTYHMTNLEVFYNREDYWEFPTEKYFDEDIEMEPYYITMKLPESDEEEFVLMTPYTPRNRQNMIAWMGVRNDGENYGETFVYRFPKQENVYGPQQIENRINQDSNISQQLNLWSQGGSEVIRGNLLVIPIQDTVLYAEPIYIESSNETSLPEVKQIILAYGDQIVMEPTFDQAIESLLARTDPDVEPSEGEEEQPEGNENTQDLIESEQKLQEISTLFDEYQNALSNGNWEEAGSIMSEIESMLGETE